MNSRNPKQMQISTGRLPKSTYVVLNNIVNPGQMRFPGPEKCIHVGSGTKTHKAGMAAARQAGCIYQPLENASVSVLTRIGFLCAKQI